jgi:hypothetical protein
VPQCNVVKSLPYMPAGTLLASSAMGSPTAHRYYVYSPERVVAIVTRGGAQAGTRYMHVDHLGSVDALTDEGGAVVERRSYDPFGQRRNPVWGQAAPFGAPPLSIVSPGGKVYIHWDLHTDPFEACATRSARPYLLARAP